MSRMRITEIRCDVCGNAEYFLGGVKEARADGYKVGKRDICTVCQRKHKQQKVLKAKETLGG